MNTPINFQHQALGFFLKSHKNLHISEVIEMITEAIRIHPNPENVSPSEVDKNILLLGIVSDWSLTQLMKGMELLAAECQRFYEIGEGTKELSL